MSRATLSGLNYDVLRQICVSTQATSLDALKNLSRTSRQIRDVSIPLVFEAVGINGDEETAYSQLTEMEEHPALPHVRCCKVKLKSHDPRDSPLSPPLDFSQALARVMVRMARLERLSLTLPEDRTTTFKLASHDQNLLLHRVTFLTLGPDCEFMVVLCPNVRTISTSSSPWCNKRHKDASSREHPRNLIQAATGASKLSHFALDEVWDNDLLESVLGAMPGLSSLSMESYRYRDGLAEMLPSLSRFTFLETLAIAGAFNLKVTDFDPPWCGNAYDGPEGQKLAELVDQEQLKAEELVVQMVFSACGGLKVLWIGDTRRVEAARGENGHLKDTVWTDERRPRFCERA